MQSFILIGYFKMIIVIMESNHRLFKTSKKLSNDGTLCQQIDKVLDNYCHNGIDWNPIVAF